MKQCSRCGALKPLDDFHRQSSHSDGRRSFCKLCANAALAAYRRTHPEAAKHQRGDRKGQRERWKVRYPDYERNRKRRLRAAAVQTLGGRCERCGWTGPDLGFDIHHANHNGAQERRSMAQDKIMRRVAANPEEYTLYCALCHRLHHGEVN